MVKTVGNFAKAVKIMLEEKSFEKARFFSSWRGGANRTVLAQFALKNNGVIHTPSGKYFEGQPLQLFAKNLTLLQECVTKYGAVQQDGKLYLSYNKNGQTPIKAEMANHQSVLCFKEIFEEQVYAFHTAKSCVVIDVGMNIGLASLFFAQFTFVKKVIGFELVGDSYKSAVANAALNPIFGGKIVAEHAAMGHEEGTVQVAKAGAGSVEASIDPYVLARLKPSKAQQFDEVTVKSADSVIAGILVEYPNDSIVLKLDCEGAEYSIIELLGRTGLLKKLTSLMIEWHYKGSQPIVDILVVNGFNVFAPNKYESIPVGMIYASKS